MAFNVLVVDDSSVMRSIIIRTLKLSGLPIGEVFEAGNGQEALKLMESQWVDLALVDINMPVMNGEEFIDHLRGNPATEDLPIIVVSTESSQTRIDSLQRKGVRFIHKPFSPEMLREHIISLTGVSDEQSFGEGSLQGSGPDF
jgi:two-component system, chemotaxis family, chemotaxis protein CheY